MLNCNSSNQVIYFPFQYKAFHNLQFVCVLCLFASSEIKVRLQPSRQLSHNDAKTNQDVFFICLFYFPYVLFEVFMMSEHGKSDPDFIDSTHMKGTMSNSKGRKKRIQE